MSVEKKTREEQEEKSRVEYKRRAEAEKQKKQQEEARERAFVNAITATRINDFRVDDGRGKDRHSVIIEIDWCTVSSHKTTLHLWKADKAYTGPRSVQYPDSRDRSTNLDFERNGKPLRFIDTDVKDGKPYYYYAWIGLTENKEDYNAKHEDICFEKRYHVARFGETFADLAQRRIRRFKHEEELRAAEAGAKRSKTPSSPLPPAKRELVDEALAIASSLLKAKKTTEQLYARLDAWCEAQELSEEDAEVIKEEVLRQLDGKETQ